MAKISKRGWGLIVLAILIAFAACRIAGLIPVKAPLPRADVHS